MGLFTGKKLFIFGFVIVLLAIIPITVYYLQQQQKTQSGAAPATTLSFDPPQKTVAVNEIFSLDIMLDPSVNLVASTTLHITYDSDKLATAGAGLTAIPEIAGLPGLNTVVENPIYTTTGNTGNITMVLSVGTDFTKTLKTKTRIATLTLKPLISSAIPTEIKFGGNTLVTAFDVDVSVLASSIPARITIAGGEAPTPTSTGTIPTPTSSQTGQNQSPICTSLNTNGITTGPAPLSITFTGIGRDTDGTIAKATFNFGDGPVQDITQAGGIGSNSVSIQTSHTYNNPATYSVSVIFTDNNNGINSPVAECQKTITVTTATGGTVAPTIGSNPTTAPIAPTSTPMAAITPPGAGDKIMGIAGAGLILSIIGGFLLFAL